MPVKLKNEKEFQKLKNKKPIKGSTPMKQKAPESKGAIEKRTDDKWRDYVLLKADYRCELCGGIAGVCHHFIFKSQSSRLRNDERNLIPLCASCHSLFHKFGAAQSGLATGRLIGKRGQSWFDKIAEIKALPSISSCRTLKYLREQEAIIDELTVPFYD